MKIVIPAAGRGTRLYPQTHTKPKPMVRVAGKPILGHILDKVVQSPIDEAIVVVGAMREVLVDYVTEQYEGGINVSFANQEQTKGLAHSVYQARSVVGDDPICIALGDMLFQNEYGSFLADHYASSDTDGNIGIKQVTNPSEYGIIETDDNRITALEEKPAEPASDLAISGFYIIQDSEWLFSSIEYLLENKLRGSGGEYQLTDALQRMIEQGAKLGIFNIGEWYDCGQPDTLLEANRVLLESVRDNPPVHQDSSVIVPPVDIGAEATLERSVLGPHVSIDDGATVIDSRVSDTILGRNTKLKKANLRHSIVGDNATVTGTPNELNVGDSSNIQL